MAMKDGPIYRDSVWNRVMRACLLVCFWLSLAMSASASSVLDEIEAQIGERSDELVRAERLLADPDPNRRIAAMEALLRSGDPVFVNKAKEVGLYSDDPRLRAAAIRAVLDAGGPMRAEFEIPADNSELTQIYDWLRMFKGSWTQDARTGYFSFVVGDFDAEQDCWKWHEGRNCVFRMSGEKVMTADWSFNIVGTSVMELDDTGTLTGAFLVNGRGTPVTIRIPLID
ncbi:MULTISPECIES: HEAT repeat domain-containing protein [unclassified Roseitalea]|uniref:HEAT repeat domain-containing protein n=1 Tax=unclassified Roseitalea TaxID=2639107 RepID=UPI00273F994A|nr:MULTISPECIES: HEAT repeat domain-containing protein [unclassified Roseitalea]